MKQPTDFDKLVSAYLKLYDIRSSLRRKTAFFNAARDFERDLRVKASPYSDMIGPNEAQVLIKKAITHAKAAINTGIGIQEALQRAEETIKNLAPYASQKVRRSVGVEEDIITADLEKILDQTVAEMKASGDTDAQISEFKALWATMTKDQKMAFAKSKFNLVGYNYNKEGYDENTQGWRRAYKRDNAEASAYLDQLKEFLGK